MTTMSEDNEPFNTPQMEEISVVEEEDITPPSTPKNTRKNVDSNGFELIVALCTCDDCIIDKKTILEKTYDVYKDILLGCNEEKFDKYKLDVEKRPSSIVDKYIRNFKSQISTVIIDKVKYVYLEGKVLTTQQLKELNKNVNNKKAKADVYIETQTGDIIGISVKQDTNCTKTNFSVEKMILSLISDEISKNELKDKITSKRKYILKTHDIDGKNIKECRDKVNELFYDSLEQTNSYWNELRTQINNNIDAIKNELVNNIFPIDLPYKLYEFDGTTFERLDMVSSSKNIEFSEYEKYYFDDKGVRRKTAKMFYRLVVNEKIYRVEIRFKGNAWGSSPQFQTHYEQDIINPLTTEITQPNSLLP
jgi:hypothetical protein